MKPIFSFFCFLQIFLFFSPLAAAFERQIACKVVGITDGDTLTCLHERNPLKVRLQYIDAPESAQPFGNRAKQALAALAFKKTVTLHISGYDRYQRLLAVVFDETNANVNLRLVELGMAWAYRQTQPMYQQAQQRAESQRIGLWQDPQPINPADWRKHADSKRSLLGKNVQNSPLQISAPNAPLATTANDINCQQKVSCGQIERMNLSPQARYAFAERYFRQCGAREMDGNGDGIPCNSLHRKAKSQ